MKRSRILFALIKKQLRELYYLTFMRKSGKKNGKSTSPVGIMILLIFAFVMVSFSMGAMFYMLAEQLYALKLGWLFHGLVAILSTAIGLISGSFFAKAQLYESKDNELLLSLPIPPSLILSSRIVSLYIQNLVTEWIILIPALAVPGVLGALTPVSAILGVLGLLVLPLFTTALSCLIGFLLAAIATKLRHKNIVTMILSVAFILGYMVLYSQMSNYLQMLVTHSEEVSGFVRRFLYPLYLYGNAMTGDALAFCLVLAGTVLIFTLVCTILSLGFFKITAAGNVASRGRYKAGALKGSTPEKALLRKELSRFFSCNAYMLNAGLGSILLIVAAVFLCFKAGDVTALFVDPTMAPLQQLIGPAMAVVIAFCVATDAVTASSISLERGISLLRSLPVHPKKILLAKVKLHLVVNLPAAVIFSIVAAIMLRLSPVMAVLLIAFSAVFVLFGALLGLLCNLRYPNFDWINETVVVKQSISVLISLFGGWLSMLLIGGGCALLFVWQPAIFTPHIAFLIGVALFGAADVLLLRVLNTWGCKTFERL